MTQTAGENKGSLLPEQPRKLSEHPWKVTHPLHNVTVVRGLVLTEVWCVYIRESLSLQSARRQPAFTPARPRPPDDPVIVTESLLV